MTTQTTNHYNRPSLSRRVLAFLGKTAFMLFFSYMFFYILLNWMMGCGEVFYTADGSYIPGECSPFWPWDLFGGAW